MEGEAWERKRHGKAKGKREGKREEGKGISK